jgi:hypothetical protein
MIGLPATDRRPLVKNGFGEVRLAVRPAHHRQWVAAMTASAFTPSGRMAAMSGAAIWSDTARRKLLIILFITWLLPIHPILAGQRLDPYRLILVVMFIPFLAALISRKAGRFLLSDALILLFGVWMTLTLVHHHGGSKFAYSVALAIEIFGGYAAGRLLIRTPDDFRRGVKYMQVALLVLLPFVVFELFTGRMMVGEILGKIFPVSDKFSEWRYGMSRVQGGFPHSILYGLFCSINAANVIYTYGPKLSKVLPRLGFLMFMTMASLSSAPSLSIIIQLAIFAWGKVTGRRWMLLVWLFVAAYFFLDFASNRGPVIIFIETVTLDPGTGWWRYYIWVYGIESVQSSPLWGIGLNDWVRPRWMAAASVDNFWLVIAMRHGLPGIFLLGGAVVVHIWHVTRAKGLSPEMQQLRTGYMIGLVGLCFTLSTVHVWDVLLVYVMYYFGAGSLFYTSPPAESAAPAVTQPTGRRGPVYTRNFSAPNSDIRDAQ